jgi:hypothetical protein
MDSVRKFNHCEISQQRRKDQVGNFLASFTLSLIMQSVEKRNCVWILLTMLLAIVQNIEAVNKKKTTAKTFVVLPKIGENFLSNKEQLMSNVLRTNYTDFVKRKVFTFFQTLGDRSEKIPPAQFNSMIGKPYNERLTLRVGRKPDKFGSALFVLSGYTKLGFFPIPEVGTSKRIKVVIDVDDAVTWMKDYSPFSLAVDKPNRQLLVLEPNNKPLDYGALYTALDAKVRTIVPVRSFFSVLFRVEFCCFEKR